MWLFTLPEAGQSDPGHGGEESGIMVYLPQSGTLPQAFAVHLVLVCFRALQRQLALDFITA